MHSLRGTKRRRWLTTALVAAATAVVLLFVPISYDVTVGHEISLDLAGAELSEVSARSIADELSTILETTDSALRRAGLTSQAEAASYTVTAQVTNRSRGQVEQYAAAFSASLAGQGVATDVSVRPLLERITGRDHVVITGVCVVSSAALAPRTLAVRSTVRMHPASRAELEAYVTTGESLDKAGAYAVQGEGRRFVAKVEGSETNVIGLPVEETLALLDEVGAA